MVISILYWKCLQMQFYAFYSLISSPVGPANQDMWLNISLHFCQKPQGHNYSFCENEMAVVIQWGQYEVYSCSNARSELGEKASANQNIDLYFPNLWKCKEAPFYFMHNWTSRWQSFCFRLCNWGFPFLHQFFKVEWKYLEIWTLHGSWTKLYFSSCNS